MAETTLPQVAATLTDRPSLAAPTTLLAELTHRCPLHCPYCSNPIALAQSASELDTSDWTRVLTEARALGVLQLGLSGGEPLVRRDLELIVAHAHAIGMYVTLVTSGLGLTSARAGELVRAGLDHIQLSIQDSTQAGADRIAGTRSWDAKLAAAAIARDMDIAFSINVVLHRANIDHIAEIIELAASLGAERLELANTQYYGWASENRAALLPTQAQLERADSIVAAAVGSHRGRMRIVYVLPDYYESQPKPCMGGWAKHYIVVSPDGRALPCHAASQITTLDFPSVREHSLATIWRESPAFRAFRGTEWMPEPCRSCDRRELDFGGCRCQAFALTGDAATADPVCSLSAHRPIVDEVVRVANAAELGEPPGFVYRRMPARA